MPTSKTKQIESHAVRALIDWKYRFATEVIAKASELAESTGHPDQIRIKEFKQAAQCVLESMIAEISKVAGDDNFAEQRAA